MTDLRVRRARTDDLSASEVEAIRQILWAAFDDPDEPEEGFTELDWEHGLGGIHVVAELNGRIAAHGSVVAREPLATSSRWRPIRASSGRASGQRSCARSGW